MYLANGNDAKTENDYRREMLSHSWKPVRRRHRLSLPVVRRRRNSA
jgi:hypothetical protein